MARAATLSLYGRVLINEWSQRVDMAFGANGILGRTDFNEVWLEGAVRIVAVAAFDQPFVDLVVEWLHKSRLSVGMALVTEAWLRRFEHPGLAFKLVDAVAARTTKEGFAVSGSFEVGVLANMARQALLIHLLRRRLRELKDLAPVAAALNMGLARAMATLACHAFAAVLEGQLGVRVVAETLGLSLMACGAGFSSDVVRRTNRRF
jgi:hypothetical protein